jgi:hypothetical protein
VDAGQVLLLRGGLHGDIGQALLDRKLGRRFAFPYPGSKMVRGLGHQFGKRRIYPRKLSEEGARRWRDAERVEGTLEIRKPMGSTSRNGGPENASLSR